MSRKYESSPIIEAICEFQFEPDPSWDFTILGLVYDKIKDKFPIRNQVAQINAAIAGNVNAAQIDAIPLMQFLQENRNTLVQVGQNLLTINQLSPYTSWDKFQPYIKESLQAYSEVVTARQIRRVALRYINRVILKQGIKLEEYFNFRPTFDQGFPEEFRSFIVGVQIPRDASGGIANLQLGTMDTDDPDSTAVLMDISFVLSQPEEIESGNVLERINTAHDQIEDIFEACITDKLRQEFKEVM
ncbi:TIGR04255 family protein [Ktedonobacteria bacterium brp13]|nr:TIGR04255 family protein [Ktedonobacteria bacterium brp13]